ncbi:carbohydrate-binding module family 20 protein [Plicaturopsis crispa FD-325 SS-3]|nr:carbohydrate-binding module family 20 protein [Plicaturopsis crispa FD-325 SS-3]
MLPNLKNATRALYGMSGLSNIMDMMRPNAGDSMEYDLTYAPISPRVETGTKTVIVQMFQWDWVSLAQECTDFLGPAGYGFVQTSPANEHITGVPWYTDYQPVTYNITSKRGTREQFSAMIQTCSAAGVGVIADVVWNHMQAGGSAVGVGGTQVTRYSYAGIYNTTNFHHCGLEPNDRIVNYNNRLEVQTCDLVGLPDLVTGDTYVQGRLAQYGDDLVSLGVQGFRLDAAKHIATTDLASILAMMKTKPCYITQETIYGSGEPIIPSEYLPNGDAQEFRYTASLKSAFANGAINGLQYLDSQGWVPGKQANVFVANHDTERNGWSLNYNSPKNTYITATVFSLAHPYGNPTVLSSYSFSKIDDPAPNNGAGTCASTGGSGGWLCQHRLPAVAGMVGFRNTVGAGSLNNFVSGTSSQIAFGRGSAGHVAINNGDKDWSVTLATALGNGAYCDVVGGALTVDGMGCTGSAFIVYAGAVSFTVPARNAVAIHVGAMYVAPPPSSTSSSTTSSSSSASSSMSSPSPSGSVSVTFSVQATTARGESLYVAGSIKQLGTWTPASAILLSSSGSSVWSGAVAIPPSTAFQYKFLRKTSTGAVTWETDPNRSNITPASGSQNLCGIFNDHKTTTCAVSNSVTVASVSSSSSTDISTVDSSTSTAASSTSTTSSSSSAVSSSTNPASTSSAAVPSGSVAVSFVVSAKTAPGEGIYLSGSIPQLGKWSTSSLITMTAASSTTWGVTVNIPKSTTFQYKFLRKSTSGTITWEPDPNRSYTTPASGTPVINTTFR